MRFRSVFLKVLQALLAPQACVVCDEWVLNSDFSPLCSRCLDGLDRLGGPICLVCGDLVPGDILKKHSICRRCRISSPAYDRARAWGPYGQTLRQVLHRYKFEGWRRLAAPLANLAAAALDDEHVDDEFDWLIPVPSHPRRLRERGFDHTRLLGRSLSKELNVPLLSGLARARNTRPQFGLDRSERKRNLRGAFRLRKNIDLEGQRVLLLDDVLTTGTTVEEACRLLRKEGKASHITVVTVARAVLAYRN